MISDATVSAASYQANPNEGMKDVEDEASEAKATNKESENEIEEQEGD